MCGIVGYLGSKNAVEIILEGLSRLEYRGYDSAGICIKESPMNDSASTESSGESELSEELSGSTESTGSTSQGGLTIYKKIGKVQKLKEHVLEKNLFANIGIGHTRWATHGSVINENAHPHGDNRVAIVHNGIIENASFLRQQLSRKNNSIKFISETDSEVFYVMVCGYLSQGLPLVTAVSESFKCIEGNSAFVVIDHQGEEIVSVKRGAPLVCGDNPSCDEIYISSDPYALIGYAERLYFPEDEVVCVLKSNKNGNIEQIGTIGDISKNRLCTYELDGSISERVLIQKQQMKYNEVGKGPYEHYMQKEIFEQPQLIRNWLTYYTHGEGKSKIDQVKKLIHDMTSGGSGIGRIHIIACGTAWHAGLLIRNYIEKGLRIPVNVELASEFRYQSPIIHKNDISIFISQSGETADTLAAQELCKEEGMTTISIVNVEGSTLYRNCHYNLLIKADAEIGVASTKAFTLQVLTGYLLSLKSDGPEYLKKENTSAKLREEIGRLAQKIETLLQRANEIEKIACALYSKKGFLFTGRGAYYPIALESALKLKEIAYVHAEGYAAGELKHGPIALIDEEMVNVAIIGPELYEKTMSNVEEIRARKGTILALAPHDKLTTSPIASEIRSDYSIALDFTDSSNLHPLYINVATQLFAYFVAKLRGTDIDQPRNLAKSVTVE
ncbi:MAG: glutamine--fructose-6-phosphate transaminase (isomerizing) [Oligoflexia bacterium]|nr:glutamine--fructose-6-phosphate transaminase (isomerizing) [Oligoflexia bacterium]